MQCSAERLALHLAEFFLSTVGRSLEFTKLKKTAPGGGKMRDPGNGVVVRQDL